MTFIETVSGVLGATRQSWRAQSVRDVLAEVVAANPRASDRELLEKFTERVREDDAYFLAVCEYSFDNALHALRREQRKPTAQQRAQTAALRAKEAAAHADLVFKIKAGVALLSMKMPNGKTLAKCTGEECAHFGGWFARVAARVGPKNIVGDVLSEKDARELYRTA